MTPPQFVLGIKLNAGDCIMGDISEEGAFSYVRRIALLGVDFIEISGGDYETPSRAGFPSSIDRSMF